MSSDATGKWVPPMKVRDILLVACPKCGATAGSLCKRLTPGRYPHIDGVHKARREVAQSGRRGSC